MTGPRIVTFLLSLLAAALLASPGARADGTRWALLVGIDHYQRRDVTGLNFSVADVEGLAAALREAAGFPSDNVFVLTSNQTGDDAPTRTNVAYRLDWLAQRVQPGDTVLFFFSGHGIEMPDNGGSFLLTMEADARSASTLQDSSLDAKRLQERLQNLKARHLLVFVDACRSDPRSGRSTGDNLLRGNLSRDLSLHTRPATVAGETTVAATIMSCSRGERSYEWADKSHGFFTYFLIQGIRGKAADGTGRVTLATLTEYLEQQVSKAVERATGQRQVPFMINTGSGLSSWALVSGLRPGAATTAPAQPTSPSPAPIPNRSAEARGLVADGQSLMRQHSYKQAEAVFSKAISLDDRNAEAYAGRGGARRYVRQFEGALADCNHALELDPKCLSGWFYRAVIYARLDRFSDALSDLDAALQIDPRNARVLAHKGYCLAVAGNGPAGLQAIEKSLEVDPREATAYTARASLRFQREKTFSQAMLDDLNTAIRIDPKLDDAYLWRALVYGGMNRVNESLADLTTYIQLLPLEPQGFAKRALIYLKASRYEEALHDADAALRIERSSWEAWYVRGIVLMVAYKDQEGGLEALREAVKLEPSVRLELPPQIQSRL